MTLLVVYILVSQLLSLKKLNVYFIIIDTICHMITMFNRA